MLTEDESNIVSVSFSVKYHRIIGTATEKIHIKVTGTAANTYVNMQ